MTMTFLAWLLSFAVAFAGAQLAPDLPHPHVPKAIAALGAGGKLGLQWFTVPFNAEHLAKLEKDFTWHLGFASFENAMPLRAGDVAVPPGRWKLDALRGATGQDWSLALSPFELWQARRAVASNPAAQEDLARIEKELAERGVPARIVVPTEVLAAGDAEHLEFEVLLRGYAARARFSVEPAGGLAFALRLHFGTLHRSVEFTEVYEARPLDATGETRR
ncbi:MAG: hypothetical protein IT457_06795 [Planctomycetes bacterium]|nr:hypothetical protein [Planctomycetota bacterium]